MAAGLKSQLVLVLLSWVLDNIQLSPFRGGKWSMSKNGF